MSDLPSVHVLTPREGEAVASRRLGPRIDDRFRERAGIPLPLVLSVLGIDPGRLFVVAPGREATAAAPPGRVELEVPS